MNIKNCLVNLGRLHVTKPGRTGNQHKARFLILYVPAKKTDNGSPELCQ